MSQELFLTSLTVVTMVVITQAQNCSSDRVLASSSHSVWGWEGKKKAALTVATSEVTEITVSSE